LGTRRFADIDQDHGPVLPAVGSKLPLLGEAVFGEMPRVAFRGVAAPVDNQIGPVFDFAQRTRNLAAQLGSYLGSTVSAPGKAIDYSADQLGKGDGLRWGRAGDVAGPVDKRRVSLVQTVGRALYRLIDAGLLAID